MVASNVIPHLHIPEQITKDFKLIPIKIYQALVKVLVTKFCPILCHPMDCSPQVSSVHAILQTSLLEQVATPFSSGFSRPKD